MKTYNCSILRLLITSIFILLGLSFTTCKQGTLDTSEPDPVDNPDWQLVWSEEFNKSTIDTNTWTFDIGNGSWGWGNNESEYYTNRTQNAFIENGNLVIAALEESYGGYNYTSARLKTQGKKTFTYGKIEARIKLPYGQGIWPAFWMLGSNINSVSWPKCGEIDILEMVGGTTPTSLNRGDRVAVGTAHWEDLNGNHQWDSGYTATNDQRLADNYHLFSIIWDSNSITWYFDNEAYYEVAITSEMNELQNGFFILLNLAVGGNWPGYPDETTEFPQKMYIDYIRYYQ